MPATRTEPNRRSHSRRPKPGHIPRPKNAFMCYRSWFYENKPLPPTADGKKLNQQVLSKQVAITWNSMTPDEQAPFHEMAKQEKKAHELKYPSYSYSPGKMQTKVSVAKSKRSARSRRRPSEDEVSEDDQSTSDDREESVSPLPTYRTLRARRTSDASCVSGKSAPPHTSPTPPPSPTPSLCITSSASEPDLDERDVQERRDTTLGGNYYIDQSLVVLPGQKELEPLLVSYNLERPAHLSNDFGVFGAVHDTWSVDDELFSPYYLSGDIAPYDTVYFDRGACGASFAESEVTSSFWAPEPTSTLEAPSHAKEDEGLAKAVDCDPPIPTIFPSPATSTSATILALQETEKTYLLSVPTKSTHSPAREVAALPEDPDPGPQVGAPQNFLNRIFDTFIVLKDSAD